MSGFLRDHLGVLLLCAPTTELQTHDTQKKRSLASSTAVDQLNISLQPQRRCCRPAHPNLPQVSLCFPQAVRYGGKSTW